MTNKRIYIFKHKDITASESGRETIYFGHIICNDRFAFESTITGLVPVTRRRGRPATARIDNIFTRTNLKLAVAESKGWNGMKKHY